MPTAYVLINCDLNHKTKVIEELSQLPGIQEASELHGAYDILVKINLKTVEDLKETVKLQLKKMASIKSTVTLIAIESTEKPLS
jgi:Lrp/AsnC family transcriptional regulator, regulator for asnA, asnC and gidA